MSSSRPGLVWSGRPALSPDLPYCCFFPPTDSIPAQLLAFAPGPRHRCRLCVEDHSILPRIVYSRDSISSTFLYFYLYFFFFLISICSFLESLDRGLLPGPWRTSGGQTLRKATTTSASPLRPSGTFLSLSLPANGWSTAWMEVLRTDVPVSFLDPHLSQRPQSG